MTSIFVVDDHSMVRKGIALLAKELGWQVAGESSTLADARQAIHRCGWDMMVLDLNLPDGSGIDFISEVRAWEPRRPILAHSLLSDDAVASRVLKAGGTGFISKTCTPEEFQRACQKVMAGGRYISPEYAEALALSAAGGASRLHDRLSEREYQVMCLIAAGKSPGAVAESIGCNINTISTYRARILKKLELKSSMDIMRYALSNKLVNL